jgi:hypothetical protein
MKGTTLMNTNKHPYDTIEASVDKIFNRIGSEATEIIERMNFDKD